MKKYVAIDCFCGAGGLSDLFIPDVTKELQELKIEKIKNSEADHIISACPRCIAQIEEGIHAQSGDIMVEDIVNFLIYFLKG